MDRKFSAAGNTKAEAQIEQVEGRKSILAATGCVVDEIAGFLRSPESRGLVQHGLRLPFLPLRTEEENVPPEFSDYTNWLRSPSAWLKNKAKVDLSDLIKQMLARYLCINTPLSGDAKILAFLQALSYDRTQSGEVAGSYWWDPFQVLIHNGHTTSTSPKELLTETQLQQARDYVDSFLDRISGILAVTKGVSTVRRELYITRKGLIGLGEPHAKKGDLVCVLKGCFRPILVKKKGNDESKVEDGRKVIRGASHGCTYLHDYMDGRAIREMESNVLETCMFRLE